LRLQAAELSAAGVASEVRLDPILPGLTDDESSFDALYTGFADSGVRNAAASVLFLRPAVLGCIRRYISESSMLHPLLNAFAVKERIRIHAGKSIVTAFS